VLFLLDKLTTYWVINMGKNNKRKDKKNGEDIAEKFADFVEVTDVLPERDEDQIDLDSDEIDRMYDEYLDSQTPEIETEEERRTDRILYGGRAYDTDNDEGWEMLGPPETYDWAYDHEEEDIEQENITEEEEKENIEKYVKEEQKKANKQHKEYLQAEAKRLAEEDEMHENLMQADKQKQREKNFQEIIKTYRKISLINLAKLLKFPDELSLQKFLIRIKGEKAFHIEGKNVIIPEKVKRQTKESSIKVIKSKTNPVCKKCGKQLKRKGQVCPDCEKKELTCVVCKLPIKPGSMIGFCSHCEARGHLDHFQEWVKVKGKCPKCKKELHVSGIVSQEV